LAYVRLHNGDDLATLILQQGLGRVYRFDNESFDRLSTYNSAEQTAQNDNFGIWANSGQQCR
jgi:endonuclease YncB( thermonuclease family)